jgi:pantetheine-phosphate adenylyltransferase
MLAARLGTVTTALYSGSFDPVHLGHLSVIEAAARAFDGVVVVALGNPAKTTGLLSVPDRVALLEQSTAHLGIVTCTSHHGLTVDAARIHGASVIVRSAHKEQANELVMAATNRIVGGIDTWFVPGDPSTGWISSSLVRSLLDRGEVDQACDLVPAPVAAWIRSPAAPGPAS